MRSSFSWCGLIAIVGCVAVACSGLGSDGCAGGSNDGPTSDWGGGDGFDADKDWKTNLPIQLKDSSATMTVEVVMQFASAFTAADSMEVVSSGGIVRATNIPPSTSFIFATYPAGKLLDLARTYAGSRIRGVSWNYFGGSRRC
jgi:hypothetical protein